jgi:hypothetical protein
VKKNEARIPFISIAERHLYFKNATGGLEKEVILRIGAPYNRKDGPGAACPVEILGIVGRTRDIVGIDTLHALESAVKFSQSFIDDPGVYEKLVWPDGQPYEPAKSK